MLLLFSYRFPSFVQEEHLQTFLGKLKVKKGVLHPNFQVFVKRALEWEASKDTELEENSQLLKFEVMESAALAHVLNSNVKDMTNISLSVDAPQFGGASLVFIDIPKVSLRYSLKYFM